MEYISHWKLWVLFYKEESIVDTIRSGIHADLKQAIVEYTPPPLYAAVDHIKVVIKQLSGCSDSVANISNVRAAELTNTMNKVMKVRCDHTIGINSQKTIFHT